MSVIASRRLLLVKKTISKISEIYSCILLKGVWDSLLKLIGVAWWLTFALQNYIVNLDLGERYFLIIILKTLTNYVRLVLWPWQRRLLSSVEKQHWLTCCYQYSTYESLQRRHFYFDVRMDFTVFLQSLQLVVDLCQLESSTVPDSLMFCICLEDVSCSYILLRKKTLFRVTSNIVEKWTVKQIALRRWDGLQRVFVSLRAVNTERSN